MDILLKEERVFPPPDGFRKQANVRDAGVYGQAARDRLAFWESFARQLHWFRPWDQVLEWKLPYARWFVGGETNLSFNCLDRHLSGVRRTKTAILWEGEPGDQRALSYEELHGQVCRFANGLKELGVRKGDRITLYMPMVPELAIAMLACARIGAAHSVVFGGFSAEALRGRLNDSKSKVLVTADGGWRRGAVVPLKGNADEAVAGAPTVEKMIVFKRLKAEVPMKPGRDLWWHELIARQPDRCEAEPLDSEQMLYLLYTSGTTGKPKGIVHTTGGTMVGCYATTQWIFDLKEEDIYWCVPPGTKVIANPEPKPINEIKVGDRVLAHDGTFCEVRRLYRRPYQGDLIKIKTLYCDEPFLMTPNHSVLCGRKGETGIQWKPAGELTKKDYVLLPKLRETRDCDFISVSSLLKKCVVKDGRVRRRKVKFSIPERVPLQSAFMRLAGYYVAEGSVAVKGYALQFSFGKHEERYADDVLSILREEFGIQGKKMWIDSLCEVRVGSVLLCELMQALFGKGASAKRLPDEWLYLPDAKLKEWLKGFWRGDGNTDRDAFRFHTTSEVLAYQIRMILTKLGLFSSISCRKKEKIGPSRIGQRSIFARNDCYCLKVGGRSLQSLSEILGVPHPFIKKRSGTRRRGKCSTNYLWLPIRSIERVPYEGDVHNIETDKHSYVLSNMAVHNCTADIGWVTGHSYVVYGPLLNGATTLMYEGAPDHPGKDRFWEIVRKYRVSIFYTAPTAIRAFMKWGEDFPRKHDLTSLRLLGSVGEPINPEAWVWYHRVIGGGRCPIVDTWWQTETGHIMISPLPGLTDLKPGSATRPFPGIEADVVDDQGKSAEAGYLVIRSPWPGMLRGIYGDPERYQAQYWDRFPGLYFAGDGCRRDAQGYFWLLGRVDDVLKVSGHRLSTMEIESALVDHPSVAEAAAIGKPHDLKEHSIVAFVTLKGNVQSTPALSDELKAHVVKKIGSIARPDEIIFTAELPKTRSGKIMRRLLRDIAEGKAMGDTTTLADLSVVQSLKEKYSESE